MALDRSVNLPSEAAEWLQELNSAVKDLLSLVKANPKTKKEIKNEVSKLNMMLNNARVVEGEKTKMVDKATQIRVQSTSDTGTPEAMTAEKRRQFHVTADSAEKATQCCFQDLSFLEEEDKAGTLFLTKDTRIAVRGGTKVTLTYTEATHNEAHSQSVSRKILAPTDQSSRSCGRREGTDGDWEQVKTRKKRKNRTEEIRRVTTAKTLEVEGGNSYADVLKAIRALDVPKEVDILSIKKNSAGNVVIRSRGETESVVNSIQTVQGLRVKERSRLTYLTIKDMDNQATMEELQTSLEKTGYRKEEVTVLSMRPAYGETQKATVKATRQAAQALLKEGRVVVGWVKCKVVAREDTPSCYRCWEKGHKAHQCQGTDRRNLCYRCGEEGHKVRTCAKEEKCLKCNGGHKTVMCRQQVE
jgi:hypothetical protein